MAIKMIKIISYLLITFLLIQNSFQVQSIGSHLIQANHFVSETQHEKTYQLDNINTQNSLVIVIETEQTQKGFLPVQINMKTAYVNVQCVFKKSTDICVIQKALSDKYSLKIKCDSVPCSVFWSVYQSQKSKINQLSKTSKLYQISQTHRHMILQFTCNDVDFQFIDGYIDIHTNNNFQKYSQPNIVTVIFNNIENGYLWIKIDDKIKHCLQVQANEVKTQLQEQTISDFIVKNDPSFYDIKDFPDNAFKIDISLKKLQNYYQEELDQIVKNNLVFTLIGLNGELKKILRKVQIELTNSEQIFSVVIPKVDQSVWNQLSLQIQSQLPIFIQMSLAKDRKLKVQPTQYSYFDLREQQVIQFVIQPQFGAEQTDDVQIFLSNKDKLKSSFETCKLKTGCFFQISATQDINGHIYVGQIEGSNQLLVLDIGDSNKFTKKIRENQNIYLKKRFQEEKPYQVVVNTPNIMVFAASQTRCKVPNQKCYDKVGNIHNPFIIQPRQGKNYLFMIKGLDHAQFTITLIQQGSKYVTLKDSQPFSYTLDNHQDSMRFQFFNKNKQTCTFNLIGPLHSLDFYVVNSRQSPKGEQNEQNSIQGFFFFQSTKIDSQYFSILVKRSQQQQIHNIHFTIIASTKQSNLRLQPGITHYQTLNKYGIFKFVFEFNSKDNYLINFFISNIKVDKVSIKILVSPTQLWDQVNGRIYIIDKTSYILQLQQIAQQVCTESGQSADNCQLFIQIKSQMNYQIDFLITLMTKHTVIQLQDGIWQTFSLHQISQSSHFYFQPSHQNQDINIIYKSQLSDLRLGYKKFNTLNGKINPAEWPFPKQKPQNQHTNKNALFKPVRNIVISSNRLQQCHPSCVILMSLVSFSHKDMIGTFSIMATNNILQILPGQKIDIVIAYKEQKSYLIDLKQSLQKDKDIIINTADTLGYSLIYGNIYSQNNKRIPDIERADFYVDDVETIIKIQQIREILENQEMQGDKNIYIYLIIEGMADSKLSIEYNLNQENRLKMLDYDSFEFVSIQPQDIRDYYIKADQQFQIKVQRLNGYPFIKVLKCQKKQYKQCIKDLDQLQGKGKQMITKTQIFKDQPCQQCIFVIRIQSLHDPSEIQIHVQSKFAQIQLIQGSPTSDFTQKDQFNRYTVYAVKDQEIAINIHVTSGQINAQLTDLAHLNQKQRGDNIITFFVPADYYSIQQEKLQKAKKQFNQILKQQDTLNFDDFQDKQNKKKVQQLYEFSHTGNSPNNVMIDGFGLSEKFAVLHISINSVNSQISSKYTISYTSGSRQMDLQDGFIVDYYLQQNIQNVFYYQSQNQGHAFLTISMQSVQDSNLLSLKMFGCTVMSQDQPNKCPSKWDQFSTQKPFVQQNTENPTVLFTLPAFKQYKFSLTFKGEVAKISIGINHQQVILLPLNHEYPFSIHKSQYINFIVEIKNEGHLLITLRKCDESDPKFGFTFDQDHFQNQDYDNELYLDDDPKTQLKTKVQNYGILYMHFDAISEDSMMSVKVQYSEEKFKGEKVKAGNKGLIKYLIKSYQEIELIITKPTCQGKQCQQEIKYTVMSSPNMKELYTKLVCPTSYFAQYFQVELPQIKQQIVVPTVNKDGTLSLIWDFEEDMSFVGVKACIGDDQEVFYKPEEVVTLWGQLTRTSSSHKVLIGSVVLLVIGGIIYITRATARKGYKKIKQFDE